MYALLVTVRGQGAALATLVYGAYATRREADDARARVRADAAGVSPDTPADVTVRVVPLERYPGREIQNPTREGGR